MNICVGEYMIAWNGIQGDFERVNKDNTLISVKQRDEEGDIVCVSF